ncbi:hypothetical protein HYT25_02980 [Candidatus Pacearchaeota archaeon]|nr:hypothetical protein [Candidatus Pacearchaeota archaeon]
MKNFIFFVTILLFLVAPVIAQENELGDPGITPDSPFYFLDRMFDGFQSAEAVANEKAAETLAMAREANAEALGKAVENYNKAMERRQAQSEDDEEVAEEIARQASMHLEVLARVRGEVPQEALFGIDTALETSARGRESSIDSLRELNPSRGEEVARETIQTIMQDAPEEALEGLNKTLSSIGSQDLNVVRERNQETDTEGEATENSSTQQETATAQTNQPIPVNQGSSY